MDSFILAGKKLHVFQFTIAQEHDIKDGIVPFLTSMRKKYEIIFIVIIPSDLEVLKCPYPTHDFFRNLTLHSAMVDISNRELTNDKAFGPLYIEAKAFDMDVEPASTSTKRPTMRQKVEISDDEDDET